MTKNKNDEDLQSSFPSEETSDKIKEPEFVQKNNNSDSSPKQNELEELQAELNEWKLRYQRSLADSENARKRMLKEREMLTSHAVENVVCDFLGPLDSFETALSFASNSSDEIKNWAVGFNMILTQFKEILTSNKIEHYESVGQPFNPHLHEAIDTIETSDIEAGIVVEECSKGYINKLNNRPVRVAKVKVSKQPSQNNA